MVIFAFWTYYTMKEFKSPVKSFKSRVAKVQNMHERSKLTHLKSKPRKQDSVSGSTIIKRGPDVSESAWPETIYPSAADALLPHGFLLGCTSPTGSAFLGSYLLWAESF